MTHTYISAVKLPHYSWAGLKYRNSWRYRVDAFIQWFNPEA